MCVFETAPRPRYCPIGFPLSSIVAVYVYKCNKSTLQIKGKPNSICIDGCSKVSGSMHVLNGTWTLFVWMSAYVTAVL